MSTPITYLTRRAWQSAVALLAVVALWAGGAVAGAPARAAQEAAGDLIPPARNVRVVDVADRAVTVAWDPPQPDTGLGGYQVLRDGNRVGRTGPDVRTFTDRGLNVATEYRYSVVTEDVNGQAHYESLPVHARTTGTVPPPPADPVKMGVFHEKGGHLRGFHVKDLVTSGTAAKLSHLTYAYGAVHGGQCAVGDTYESLERAHQAGESVDGRADTWDQPLRGHLNQLRKLKERQPGLKVLWSFGGPEYTGGATSGFAQALQDSAGFAASCVRLLDDPRWAGLFDGIDLSWRFPDACYHGCDSPGPASLGNLTRAFRTALGADRPLTVTIEGRGASGRAFPTIDFQGAEPYATWFNLAGFDYYTSTEPDRKNRTAPHAVLRDESWDGSFGNNAHSRLRQLTARPVHPNKLVLGVPTHAWGWEGVRDPGPPTYANGPAPGMYENGREDYRLIKTRCPNPVAFSGTAYAHCGNQWWTYDTPASVATKAAYVKSYGHGGMYLSDLRGDTADGELASALARGLG
ncbi:glycosyl hydrolase family 18 protein [Streptomyces sp. NPDC020875]|uniref:glycoside hydrolase family 18 protein n=1 Tax=Streptomyces sp. NPDC020875 TaxID=3154898 RepID=UPI0033DA4FCD